MVVCSGVPWSTNIPTMLELLIIPFFWLIALGIRMVGVIRYLFLRVACSSHRGALDMSFALSRRFESFLIRRTHTLFLAIFLTTVGQMRMRQAFKAHSEEFQPFAEFRKFAKRSWITL